MNSFLTPNLRDKTWWRDVIFYGALGLLGLAALCYLIFFINIHFERKKIAEIDAQIAVYGTQEQQRYEKEIIAYKRKIDDFLGLIGNHKISLNIFNFIERNTLPNIWFEKFDMSESTSEIKVTGEADNLASLSQQIRVFEEQKGQVKYLTVLESRINIEGKIEFTLALALDQKIFNYNVIPSGTTTVQVPSS